jgi:DNA-binding SARP family transcriptional activator
LVPSPTGLLHRHLLCEKIEQGLQRKLVLVSAPAGYGKTSALVDFAHTVSAPVCWYTTDDRDRDLTLFIRYIVGAIAEQFPGFGKRTHETLTSRASDLFREPTAAVGDLVNEMLALDSEFVLVLDNFEAVDGAFGVREFVRRMLDVLPPNCHLMIGSRTLPDVPVTRLVANRQLAGLTERDLRFEPEEVRNLLGRSGVDVTESQAGRIASNAEGWITGVLLILDLLRDDAASVLANTGKATAQTYGYLASEVLSRQPRGIQSFLLTSSVLREMSARLCREALGLVRPSLHLSQAERRNLFLTRFGDDAGAAYRFHNLFRGFLQDRLRGSDPSHYAELHRRAGTWFEQVLNVDEAVYHFLAAETYAQATALMEQASMEWFTRGRSETLLGWARALPEAHKSRAPWLSLYESRVLTDRYDYGGAREALAHAESGFSGSGDRSRLAKVHNQRAALDLLEGRLANALSEAEAALGILGHHEVTERAHALRHIGGVRVRSGRFSEGVSRLEEALALFREVDSQYDIVCLLQDLTFAFASQGRLDRAAVYLSEALPIARRLGSPSLVAGVINNLGMLHYERGEYRQAFLLYQEGLSVARRGHDARGEANLADGLAGIYRDIGSFESADTLYDVAWAIARESRPGQAVRILAARADMCRWQGNRERARAHLDLARQLAEDKGLKVEQHGILGIGIGIVLAEDGETEQGLGLLADAVDFLEQRGALQELARGRFLLAKAHLLGGDTARATAELQRALALAREIGTNQPAAVEGQHAPELVQLALARGLPGGQVLHDRIQHLRALVPELDIDRQESSDGLEEHLDIYALGAARVVRNGRPIPRSAWRAAMAKELFFYILFHGPVDRDAVGLVFWPDLPSQKVSSNFHSTLYRVRRAVGGDAVVVENGRYHLAVSYRLDVDDFDALVERARLLPPQDWQAAELWRRAVRLYRGELLPEVDREWCVVKRQELGDKYIEALVELGRYDEARGEVEAATERYRQALEMNQLREDIHRRIMQAYANAGRRSDAVTQYQRCRDILTGELGIEPSMETQRLLREISGHTSAPAPAEPRSTMN